MAEIGYVTMKQIRAALSDSLGANTTTYDVALQQIALRASRTIDAFTGRVFYPEYLVRYLNGNGKDRLRIPECMALSAVEMSSDYGSTYTALAATDYITYGGRNEEPGQTPITVLEMYVNGSYSHWYTGQRSLKLTGLWGWHDRYADAWASSGDSVKDAAGISAVITTITVNDADGVDEQGQTPRFQIGQLIKIDSEHIIVTAVTAATTNTLTVLRAQNGTTGATHALSAAITIYRPPEVVVFATLIESVRMWSEGRQGFSDVGGFIELGQLRYAQGVDPRLDALLSQAGLRRITIL